MDRFILCYDISDEKRLAKIAKIIERISLRIQRSIYYFEDMSEAEIVKSIDKALSIMDKEKDDLRIYRIRKETYSLYDGIDLNNPYTVV
jgi:CRISPR-associated protein Cas2